MGTVAGLLVAYAVFIYRTSWMTSQGRRFTLFDDAMVSMAYARTLAEGGGWGWYPGAEPVEGYSNPAWMLVMAVVHLLPGGDRVAPVLVMLVGCVLVGARVARLLGAAGPWVVPVTGLLVGLSYPLVFWTLRGMEVGLVALEALALIWVLLAWDEDRQWRWGLAAAGIAAVGLFTRLDFGVLAAAACAWLVVLGGDRRWRRLAAVVVGVVASAVVQTAFRLAVFGEVVPNTYTLKIGGAELVERLSRGGLALALFVLTGGLVLAGLAVLALVWSDRAHRRVLVLPLAMFGLLAAYGVWVGGDVWEESLIASRFLATALPLLALPAVVAISMAVTGPARRLWTVAATVVLTGLGGAGAAWALRPHFQDLGIDPDGLAAHIGWSALVAGIVAALLLVAAFSSARTGRAAATAVLLAVSVAVLGNGLALRTWQVSDGGHLVHSDQVATDLGLTLGRITEPGARIAVVWAGAPVYWSRRGGVDLLGKADPVVAADQPHEEYGFRPGHMKWDYTYSIRGLRPDVVAQMWLPDADQRFYLTELGYRLVRPIGPDRDYFAEGGYVLGPAGVWALEGSPYVRWDQVEVVP